MNSLLEGTSMHRTNKDIAEYMFNNKLPADKQQELDMAYSLFKQAFVSGSSKAERYARQAKNSLMLRLKEEGYGGCVAIKGVDYKGKSYYLTIDDVLSSYKLGS
jgi:hypothetical protein